MDYFQIFNFNRDYFGSKILELSDTELLLINIPFAAFFENLAKSFQFLARLRGTAIWQHCKFALFIFFISKIRNQFVITFDKVFVL